MSTSIRRVKTSPPRRFFRIAARRGVSSLVCREASSQLSPLGLPRCHSIGFARFSSTLRTTVSIVGITGVWRCVEGRETACRRNPKSRSTLIMAKSLFSMALEEKEEPKCQHDVLVVLANPYYPCVRRIEPRKLEQK